MKLSSMGPKEVQELRPGPYIIYFNPNKPEGYGVYRKKRYGNRVKEQGLDDKLTLVIEVHECIIEVSKREIELQVSNGYKPNIIPYWKTLLGQIKIAEYRKGKPGRKTIPWTYTKEAIQNRVNNSPLKEMGRKTSERQKGKIQSQWQSEEVKNKRIESLRKALNKKVAAYYKDGILYKVFDSPTQAAEELNVSRGIIYDTLGGRQKSCRGFIWKYLDTKE